MSRAPDPKCLFCKLVSRALPVSVVAENDEFFAFNDINPQAPHHILVIPKAHIPGINDAAPEEALLLGRMLLYARDIAEDHDFAEPGYRLVINSGRHAGQSVFHIHLHVLAGRFLSWPPG